MNKEPNILTTFMLLLFSSSCPHSPSSSSLSLQRWSVSSSRLPADRGSTLPVCTADIVILYRPQDPHDVARFSISSRNQIITMNKLRPSKHNWLTGLSMWPRHKAVAIKMVPELLRVAHHRFLWEKEQKIRFSTLETHAIICHRLQWLFT